VRVRETGVDHDLAVCGDRPAGFQSPRPAEASRQGPDQHDRHLRAVQLEDQLSRRDRIGRLDPGDLADLNDRLRRDGRDIGLEAPCSALGDEQLCADVVLVRRDPLQRSAPQALDQQHQRDGEADAEQADGHPPAVRE